MAISEGPTFIDGKYMIKKIILSLAVLVLALGAYFYIYKDLNKPKTDSCDISSTSSDCVKNAPESPEPSVPQSVITPISAKTPDLNKPVVIPDGWPADTQKIMKLKIESLISDLKKNPDSFDNWLNLGTQRKTINDYEGAGECWEYAGVIRPLNYVSYNNLGELYGYYLKDYKKAEENYLTAIKNGPDQVYIYRNMYEFYRNVTEDDAKAKAILGKGIATNPDTSKDLKYLLDNF
jgi:tetratricopeptide (TPR) repeat protein